MAAVGKRRVKNVPPVSNVLFSLFFRFAEVLSEGQREKGGASERASERERERSPGCDSPHS
jgi:hypothetical protein